MAAGEVDTEEVMRDGGRRGEGRGAGFLRDEQVVEGQEDEAGIFGGVEEVIGKEGGVFIGREAAIFLEPLFFVEAFGAEAGEEGLREFVAARFFVDAVDDAFGDGFLDGNGVEGPAHGVIGFGDGAEDFVKNGVVAAVGGDDGELAAPGGDGFSDAVEEALVGVESELVEGDVAAFAGEGVGVGGEGVDAAAVGEFEGEGGGAGIGIEHELAELGGAALEELGPAEAVLELEAGLLLVAGGDVGVEACGGGADEEDEAEGVGVGEADLAGFDGDFERGVVVDPEALGEVEILVEVLHSANVLVALAGVSGR
jgi:hypothetical protein